jgi:hypothetical protein
MNAIMNDTHLSTFDEVDAFLAGTQALEFTFADAAARYAWVQTTLIRFSYAKLSRRQKGVLRCYLRHVTGYSRQQLTCLVTRYRKDRAGEKDALCPPPVPSALHARGHPPLGSHG